MNEYKLEEDVKQALVNAVELWVDNNLDGKPALLANGMFFALERCVIEQTNKINETFKDGAE